MNEDIIIDDEDEQLPQAPKEEANPLAEKMGNLLSQIGDTIEEEDREYKDWIKQLQDRIIKDNDTRSVVLEQLGRAIELKAGKSAKLTKTLEALVKATSKNSSVHVNIGKEAAEMSAEDRIAFIKDL